MPLWGLLALFYVIIAAVNAGAVAYYLDRILSAIVSGPELVYAVWFAGVMVGVFLLLVAALFFVLGRLVARPARRLVAAMRAYAETGSHAAIQVPGIAPSEIRELAAAFGDLAVRIDTAHAKDTEVSRVKSDFISTAAHQLRTPLTAVRWALEALEKSGLSPDQEALARNAVEKSKDLVAIVGTLLDISSIESGKYQYAFKSVDLGKVAADVSNDFAPLAASSKVSLLFSKEGELPPARADGERIKWVLNNLVENAVRYTPAGGSVRITGEASRDRVIIRVRDTGIGIPEGERQNIFERFYRAGNAIAKENEGNGLGLYIARQIANDHGGDLTFAANQDGPGTTFTLSLPRAAGA
jgi:signal transduction histidine kinase